MARRPSRLALRLRFMRALLARFRLTLLLTGVLLGLVPILFRALYMAAGGARISLGQAVHHVYFLMFGQPSLEYVDSVAVELMNLLIPPLGVAVVVDGVVRFAYLFFAKHRRDKEWIEVMSEVMQDHVIVCGAGRVGFRVTEQLRALGHPVLVIEKHEAATFVGLLRDMEIPVLIEDIRGHRSLERLNVKEASAIVCATNDDLANMNIALDARRLNPNIRVVLRLFDDDLVAKVKDTFKAEALSTSALAAPAMALAALDPRIIHSFQVGGHLLVVSHFHGQGLLVGLKVSDIRERFGGLVLAVRTGGQETLHPRESTPIAAGDVLTLQSEYADYLSLRKFTGEEEPPISLLHAAG